MAENRSYYPLTHPQKRIWYTEKLHPGTSIGNLAGTFRFKGKIDYKVLEKAINLCLEKNDAFRLRFTERNGEPYQYVSDYKYKKIELMDFCDKGEQGLFEWDTKQTRTPVELDENNLLQLALFNLNENEGGVYAKIHHMMVDGWSMVQFTSRFMEFYSMLMNGEDTDSRQYPSYIEYLDSENDYLGSERFQKDREYWLGKFKDVPEIATLTGKNSTKRDTQARRRTFIIPERLTMKIREYCEATKSSIFALFLSVLLVYINRITSKTDIVLGSPVLNRTKVREKDTIGMFTSTVPIRVNVDDSLDFTSFVKSVSAELLSILKHQKYPYDMLLKDLRTVHKDMENLYDIAFSYQNAKLEMDESVGEHECRWHFNGYQVEPLCIHVHDREDNGRLIIDYDYLTSLYTQKSIEYIHKHILNILEDALANPCKNIACLQLLAADEKQRVMFDFNATERKYNIAETVQAKFEEQAGLFPQKTAIVFEDTALSYGELNSKANQVAVLLRDLGTGPNVVVGIMTGRSLELLTGILAILKAGGAYMPIDPDYPDERIEYMISDSNVKVLLTQKSFGKRTGFCKHRVFLDDYGTYIGNTDNLKNMNSGNDLAYVLYTSGSTGTPKGVMVGRSSYLNLLQAMPDMIDMSDSRTVVSITSAAFDIFVFESLLPLSWGMTVIMANDEQQRIPRLLGELVSKYSVDILQTTPSRMQTLISDQYAGFVEKLKVIILAGEAFPDSLLQKLKQITSARIYNGYGPTETTVYSTFKDVTDARKVNIGKPIPNTSVYILDGHRNLMPIGVAGELCIAGAGLGMGYVNKPQMTSERFVSNPFVPGTMMYRSGDLARWYPQGDIEYLGRMDNQVKIRGLRIELGEIENRLVSFEEIKKAVVIDRVNGQGKRYLCAYYVSDDNIPAARLRKILSEQLPGYMIPPFFIRLDEMPLNPNGKVDRKALPEPDANTLVGEEFVEPSGKVERKLASIWKKILKIKKVGACDSFFELGGDSLAMINVVSVIEKTFNVKMPIEKMQSISTIREIAAYISSSQNNVYGLIEPVGEMQYYPLSSAQKRIFILMQMDPECIAYNMPVFLNIKGHLDYYKLKRAFNKLIQRHESFRTRFLISGTEPVQEINPEIDFNLEYITDKTVNPNELISDFVKPFIMSVAPLIRARLVKVSDCENILLFDMHHIIADGASIEIIINELTALYNGRSRPLPKVRYIDYCAWQNEKIKEGIFKKQVDFWLYRLSGEIPVLNLPYDYKRPPAQDYNGGLVRFRISRQLADKLKIIAAQNDVTLFMLLLAAYNILLSLYTGQEDIIVGTPVTIRKHSDLKNVIGMFVNTLALRNYPETEKNFLQFLSEIKSSTIQSLENCDYPFEELVSRLEIKRDLSRNPLFDTMFSLQKNNLAGLKFNGLKTSQIHPHNALSKFDLSLEACENDGIDFSFEYCTGLFRKQTIDALASHFVRLLQVISRNPSMSIGEYDILSKKERKYLVSNLGTAKRNYDIDGQVHELFEEMAVKYPDKIALVFNDTTVTYSELNSKANMLARTLRKAGVGNDKIVGILCLRSVEMMVGILAVLKSGGAYLPIDVNYPLERIRFMLEDSEAKILLTTQAALKDIVSYGCKVIFLDEVMSNEEDTSNLHSISKPEDLAYVIYTSGSTGLPKGVMVVRKALNNFLKCFEGIIELKPDNTAVSVTTISFDIFVFETLLPLTKGMKVVIANEEEQRLPHLLAKLIIRHNVDLLQTTPSKMEIIVNSEDGSKVLGNLLYISLIGEVFSPTLYLKMKETTKAKIYNGYGPTETTVYSTIKPVTGPDELDIGIPLPGYTVSIRNINQNLVPYGVAGELYIGGDGLARGYKGRTELTGDRFVNDPDLGGLMYKTGDLVKWTPSGCLQYIGRIDNQIKLNGQRIELEEIENRIKQYTGIKHAVVILRNDRNERPFLCAYIEYGDNNFDIMRLRDFLNRYLPLYMVPSLFVSMDKIPMTPNGKIDRKALPDPDSKKVRSQSYAKPTNKIENRLCYAWSEVLGIPIENIGIDDDFFELGGDSLAAIRVQIKVLEYGWEFKTQDVFNYPTIRQLASIISDTDMRHKDDIREAMDEAALTMLPGDEIISGYASSYNRTINDGVLLTGATGYLGSHLLNELLESTDSDIFCLVRQKDRKTINDRLQAVLDFYFPGKYKELANGRIHAINGDIAMDGFGIDKKQLEFISSKSGVVVHAAAIVKHAGNYNEFEKINIIGTANVISYAFRNGQSLFYISTTSVAGYGNENMKLQLFTENDLDIGQDYLDNVYIKSKLEAEKLVQNAYNSGLRASIFRIGNLTGRFSDGWFQSNMNENAFYNWLCSVIKLGVIPRKLLDHNIEMTPVDLCSKAIMSILKSENEYGKCYHIHNNFVKMSDFLDILKSLSFNIQVLDEDLFIKSIAEVPLNVTDDIIFNGIVQGLTVNAGKKSVYPMTVNSDITRKLLLKYGFKWSKTDMHYIDKIIHHIKQRGYLI